MLSNQSEQTRLEEKRKNIKEALHHVDIALNHDEYSKPFSFVNENSLKPEMFQDELLKETINEINNRNLGFDPDLFLQHLESEILDQFNDIVKKHLKGKSIVTLMRNKHALELFMLKDRKEKFTKHLNETEAELAGIMAVNASVINIDSGVSDKTLERVNEVLGTVADIKTAKVKKK